MCFYQSSAPTPSNPTNAIIFPKRTTEPTTFSLISILRAFYLHVLQLEFEEFMLSGNVLQGQPEI